MNTSTNLWTPTMRGLVVAAAAALSATSSFAVEQWTRIGVDVFSGDAAAYRTQGVTTDGTQWFFSSTNGLERADALYTRLQGQSPAIASALALPSSLADRGLNHIGDIDYANGVLYVPLDTSVRNASGGRYNSPVVALYNSADLSYTGKAYALTAPGGTQDIASWVAVDAAAGLAYGMAYDNATQLSVYNLADWSFNRYVTLSQTLDQVQGGKLLGDWMYMASDNDTKSVYRTNVNSGVVEELFQIKTPYDQEIEGLSFRQTANGLVLSVLNRESPTADTDNVSFYHYALAPVPEPQSYALLLGGLALLAGLRRRVKSAGDPCAGQ